MTNEKQKYNQWLARVSFIGVEYPFGPIERKYNEDGRLHCDDGPAIISPSRCCWYIDGRKHGLDVDIWGSRNYYYEDVLVPRNYIESPDTLTVQKIFSHPNAEVKAVGMKIYGYDRLLEEENPILKVIDEDESRGQLLFRIEDVYSDPYNVIKVVNGTPEPDGTYTQYFLSVPPDMVTCRAAVAWTFRKEPEEYNPSQET